MSLTLQLALLAGALVGLGIAVLVRLAVPAHPQLKDALTRLSPAAISRTTPDTRRPGPTAPGLSQDGPLTALADRLGPWVQRHLPPDAAARVPAKDLQLLQISTARYWGEKAVYGLVGLVMPSILLAGLAVLGVVLPVTIPVAATLVFAAVLVLVHDIDIRTRAAKARAGFTRALSAYVDLVALERAGGAGAAQSLESAASTANTWVFIQIKENLTRSRWSGQTPWVGLRQLAAELDLPDLHDLADIMAISGESGGEIYATLRAKAAAMRSTILSDDQAAATAQSARLVFPGALLAFTFIAMVATPAMLSIFANAAAGPVVVTVP